MKGLVLNKRIKPIIPRAIRTEDKKAKIDYCGTGSYL